MYFTVSIDGTLHNKKTDWSNTIASIVSYAVEDSIGDPELCELEFDSVKLIIFDHSY